MFHQHKTITPQNLLTQSTTIADSDFNSITVVIIAIKRKGDTQLKC